MTNSYRSFQSRSGHSQVPTYRTTKRPVQVDRTRMRRVQFTSRGDAASVRTLYRDPDVIFTKTALDKMGAYVALVDTEIAWMSTVERVDEDTFIVKDCFLFGQSVHSATAEIDPEAMAEMVGEILASHPEDGVEIVNSLRCWGHSHVNMATSPSGQDEKQMNDFAQNVPDYMIRVIANKRGDLRVDLFDYERGLVYEQLDWTCESNESDLETIADEIEEKVLVMSSVASSYGSVPAAGASAGARARGALLDDDEDETYSVSVGRDGGAMFVDPEDFGVSRFAD